MGSSLFTVATKVRALHTRLSSVFKLKLHVFILCAVVARVLLVLVQSERVSLSFTHSKSKRRNKVQYCRCTSQYDLVSSLKVHIPYYDCTT